MQQHEKIMKMLISYTKSTQKNGDVPIAACVVKDGVIISKAYNQREKDADPTAHAEILALKKAGKKLGSWNLFGCDLYVTLEPCAMCAGACVNARISNIYFGGYDLRFGYCSTLQNLPQDERLNHNCNVIGGILKDECIAPIKQFFKERRECNK